MDLRGREAAEEIVITSAKIFWFVVRSIKGKEKRRKGGKDIRVKGPAKAQRENVDMAAAWIERGTFLLEMRVKGGRDWLSVQISSSSAPGGRKRTNKRDISFASHLLRRWSLVPWPQDPDPQGS